MTMTIVGRAIAVLALVVFWASDAAAQARPSGGDPFAAFSGSLVQPPSGAISHRGTFYVPAYSSIRAGSGRTRLDFAVTLSIHNTSDTMPLIIQRIDYFGTSGALVQKYVQQPIALRPFGTVEVFIPTDDVRGGTGANFIVEWAATAAITEPVVETIMIATTGTASFSMISPGRPLRTVGGN